MTLTGPNCRRVGTRIAATALLLTLSAPATASDEPLVPAGISVPAGFTIETIARVRGARELAVAANGDLFVGTSGNAIEIVPDAESTAGPPRVFTRVDDTPAAGVAIASGTLFVGAQFGVYAVPFHPGERVAQAVPRKIAQLRTSGHAHGHVTTSVAVGNGIVYASVGSSCNTCDPDQDATRATIQQMRVDGSEMMTRAQHIRNAVALTIDPQTGALWAGVAGQDELAHGHPYEIIDDVSAHPGRADYGWPHCYEDRRPVTGADADACADVAVARVVVPAYETPIGATFYPAGNGGKFTFPTEYHGGLFVALHGSWHAPPVPPRVVFIPMHGDTPQTPVNWSDPGAQWREFVGGYQQSDGARIGRPTGLAVGPDGSLFVADDATGDIDRIRPTGR